MPTYVALGTWTDKGIETINKGPERLDDSKHVFERFGAKLTGFYVLMGGPPDVVTIFEAPNDHAAAQVGFALAARGTIRGSVHPSLQEHEYKEVISRLK
jgi:uncharacterized protein with GYD domain